VNLLSPTSWSIDVVCTVANLVLPLTAANDFALRRALEEAGVEERRRGRRTTEETS
jgi:hypothetical protein